MPEPLSPAVFPEWLPADKLRTTARRRRPFQGRLGMPNTLTALTIDFLAWFEAGPRPYAEVMAAWRTSCPRLAVWEDAVEAGLVRRHWSPGTPPMFELTAEGSAFLAQH